MTLNTFSLSRIDPCPGVPGDPLPQFWRKHRCSSPKRVPAGLYQHQQSPTPTRIRPDSTALRVKSVHIVDSVPLLCSLSLPQWRRRVNLQPCRSSKILSNLHHEIQLRKSRGRHFNRRPYPCSPSRMFRSSKTSILIPLTLHHFIHLPGKSSKYHHLHYQAILTSPTSPFHHQYMPMATLIP